MDDPYLNIREVLYPYGAPAYRWELIARTPAGDVSIAESPRVFSTVPLAQLNFEQARVAMAGACDIRPAWRPDWATHPGEHLQEYVEARGWSNSECVEATGLTEDQLGDLFAAKAPVTPEIAETLERVFGLKASVWTRLQRTWDDRQAQDAGAA